MAAPLGHATGDVRELTAELEQAQLVLKDAARRYAALCDYAPTTGRRENFNVSPLASFIVEPNGTIVDVNTAAARVLNVSRRHATGRPFGLFLGGNRESFAAGLHALQHSGQPQQWVVTIRPRERSGLHGTLVASLDPSGRIVLIFVAAGPLAGTTV